MSKSRRAAARALFAMAAPILLAACASAGPAPSLRLAAPRVEPPDEDASVYGLYLAGETALDRGADDAAAFYLGQASARRPGAGFLKERAFAASLVSGDVDRAAALAPEAGQADEAAYALGRVTRAVVALANGDGKTAYTLLSASSMGAHWAAAALLRPWAAAAAGDWTAAIMPVESAHDQAVQTFGELNHALLLERAGKLARAETAYQAVSPRGGVFALAYGGFLERRGRRPAAIALYDEALSKDATDPAFTAARARAVAGDAAPPAPSIRRGGADALIGPAALLLAQKQSEAGLAYLRLALRLDPDVSEAWVLVGDALDLQQDPAGAREAYAKVRAQSPEYATAQGRLALSLQESGEKDAALKAALSLAATRPAGIR